MSKSIYDNFLKNEKEKEEEIYNNLKKIVDNFYTEYYKDPSKFSNGRIAYLISEYEIYVEYIEAILGIKRLCLYKGIDIYQKNSETKIKEIIKDYVYNSRKFYFLPNDIKNKLCNYFYTRTIFYWDNKDFIDTYIKAYCMIIPERLKYIKIDRKNKLKVVKDERLWLYYVKKHDNINTIQEFQEVSKKDKFMKKDIELVNKIQIINKK